MAAADASPKLGIRCRKCRSRDLRVRKTFRDDDVVRRQRECRRCGTWTCTTESRR